MDWPLLFER